MSHSEVHIHSSRLYGPRAKEAMPPTALNIPAPRCRLLTTLSYSGTQGSLEKVKCRAGAGKIQGELLGALYGGREGANTKDGGP